MSRPTRPQPTVAERALEAPRRGRKPVTHRKSPLSSPARLSPRLVEQLPAAVGIGIFIALFFRYRQRWFIPGFSGNGYVEWVHREVAAGVSYAPNQYRPLVPWMTRWLDESAPLNLPQAILLTDAALMGAAVVMLILLGRRFDAPWLPLAGAAGYALWFAKLDHWHPEVGLLTVVVGAVALEVTRDERRRWDRRFREGPRWWVLGLLGMVTIGARTDVAATLGVTAILLGLSRRSWALGLTGMGIVGASAAATQLLVAAFPGAQYRVPVVMFDKNLLTPSSWVFVLGLYVLPMLLAPAVLAWQHRVLPPLWPVLVWFCGQFASTFVVGIVEESRIFLPFAALLAAASALAWRQLAAEAAGDHTALPCAAEPPTSSRAQSGRPRISQ